MRVAWDAIQSKQHPSRPIVTTNTKRIRGQSDQNPWPVTPNLFGDFTVR
jgi:hypothetical protein